MREEKFEGVCVGGPLDGRWLSAPRDIWEVAIAPKLNAVKLYAEADLAEAVTITKITYRHRQFERGAFVWTPYEQEIGETLKRLVACYHPPASEL